MKQLTHSISVLTMVFTFATWGWATTLKLQPESTLTLTGDSTLHPFSSRSTALTLTDELDAKRVASAKAAFNDVFGAVLHKGALQKFDLSVPVKSLKSKESGLDKNMYKALKADENPDIVFHLSGYEVTPSTVSHEAGHIKADGTLTIAGQTKPVVLEAEGIPDQDVLQVKGRYTLLMSDYGIKPPTMMMGTIKVRNPVVIEYDLRLIPQ
jgi:polyisoprenoid-binding protein YceI